jgi:hypothetical protein
MQLAQEREPGRRLAFEQHQHDRELRRFDPFVQRLVIFEDLPRTHPVFTDDQQERRRVGDLLREHGLPVAAGAQVLGSKKHLRSGILGFQSGFDPLGIAGIGGVVAEKPPPHAMHRVHFEGMTTRSHPIGMAFASGRAG